MMISDVYSPDSLIRPPSKEGVWTSQFAGLQRVQPSSVSNWNPRHSAVRVSGGEKTNVDVDLRCRYTSTLTTLLTHYNNKSTTQHKVKQRLTRRAGIASYWRDYLKPFGGATPSFAALAQCARRAGESGSDAATLSQR